MLRHTKEFIDASGWAQIATVLEKLGISKDQLLDIVETDEKKRYEIQGQFIRANQGHSVEVDLELQRLTPPTFLLHGSYTGVHARILRAGIKKMSRNYVHLTENMDTAFETGSRHGEPVVFLVNAMQMYYDGYKFFLSKNNVWLTDYVPPQYINDVQHWIPSDKLGGTDNPESGL